MNSINQKLDNRILLSNLDINLVGDGDSRLECINGAGVGLPDPNVASQYFMKKVRDYLTPLCNSISFNSYGYSGLDLEEMTDRVGTTINPAYVSGKTNILVVLCGVNSVLSGELNGVDGYNKLKEYCTIAKNTGYEYVFVLGGYNSRRPYEIWNTITEEYQPITIDPLNEIQWVQYLDSIRNETQPIWTDSYDLRDAEDIGGPFAQDWQGNDKFQDYIHLTALGYDIIYQKIVTELILKYFK